ncbi:MAG: hypothetical protein Kow00120_29890 [Anaerolineae bacterium]
MTVYVLEFERALGDPENPRGQARYYTGYCTGDVAARLAEHRRGGGAAITRAANARGIGYRVVAVLPRGSREAERRLKRRKDMPRLIARLRRRQPEAVVLDLSGVVG